MIYVLLLFNDISEAIDSRC